jgi:hypothetical protein
MGGSTPQSGQSSIIEQKRREEMKVGIGLDVEEKNGKVIITLDPAARHGQSKSGKTTIVASSQGNVTIPTSKGNVVIGVNAYVKE